ncbi:MAG: arsenate reductase (glutaredoxin) [Flavobacteriales bacterium]|nr:arsenate reductase (glutaredoxin) [Flavobacteriales bacterium]
MKIYHNPRCRKSRETLEIITNSGSDVEVVEYLKETPSANDLSVILAKLGMKPEQIIRKGEKIFKEEFKGRKLTDQQWIKVMVENPILIERPIVVRGKKAVIGRPPENVNSLLK